MSNSRSLKHAKRNDHLLIKMTFIQTQAHQPPVTAKAFHFRVIYLASAKIWEGVWRMTNSPVFSCSNLRGSNAALAEHQFQEPPNMNGSCNLSSHLPLTLANKYGGNHSRTGEFIKVSFLSGHNL